MKYFPELLSKVINKARIVGIVGIVANCCCCCRVVVVVAAKFSLKALIALIA